MGISAVFRPNSLKLKVLVFKKVRFFLKNPVNSFSISFHFSWHLLPASIDDLKSGVLQYACFSRVLQKFFIRTERHW